MPGDVPEDHDTPEAQPPAAEQPGTGRMVDVGDGQGGLKDSLVCPDLPPRPADPEAPVAQNGQKLDAAIKELEDRRQRVIEQKDAEVKAIDTAIESLQKVKEIQ